jgi:hypothetical protein
MHRLLAIAKLTWKAAFRYRLFWVLSILLLAAVVALPLIIKDDGTARGFTQILLTYTLGIVSAFLGFTTLWLSCGTLARDIEEAQMQMIVVKPVPRWQIWIGKWLGLISLNAVLLAIAGTAIYFLLLYRAAQLPESEQAILRNEILVARASFKEPVEDISAVVDQRVQEYLKENPTTALDAQLLRKQIEEQEKAGQQIVAPGYRRFWDIDLGLKKSALRDQPLFLRIKYHSPEYNSVLGPRTYRAFIVAAPDTTREHRIDEPSVASETFHEFQLPANIFDEDGKIRVEFRNYNNIGLLFPLEEGMEILYREGGFGLNFARGLCIILCWMALLAAIGLCAASLLSFPVAAFFAIAVMIVGLSTGTLSKVAEDGSILGRDHDGEFITPRAVDAVFVPLFRGALKLVNLVQEFSPIDSLSSGRSITWGQLGLAVTQIVILLGGIFAAVGIYIFDRRELATAHVNN